MSKIEWGVLLDAGLRGLGLRPAEFWALTPAELSLMLGQGAPNSAMGRAQLDALILKFPDEIPKERPE